MNNIYFLFYLSNKFKNSCKNNNLNQVQELLNSNYNINYNISEISGLTGFSYACLYRHIDKYINYNKKIFNYEFMYETTPFSLTLNNCDIIKFLIKTDKYINLKLTFYNLKVINYDQELIDLMKTEKFLKQNNSLVILEFLKYIRIIKSFKYEHITIKNKETCSICLEPLYFNIKDMSIDNIHNNISIKLPCNHEFHNYCIDQLVESIKERNLDSWYEAKLSCPLCRNPFKEWGKDVCEYISVDEINDSNVF